MSAVLSDSQNWLLYFVWNCEYLVRSLFGRVGRCMNLLWKPSSAKPSPFHIVSTCTWPPTLHSAGVNDMHKYFCLKSQSTNGNAYNRRRNRQILRRWSWTQSNVIFRLVSFTILFYSEVADPQQIEIARNCITLWKNIKCTWKKHSSSSFSIIYP
jgi:hypothetical protein